MAGPVRVIDAFGIQAGERVVEIGPGTGFYSVEAARRIGRGGQLICIDLQIEMLQHLKRRLETNGQHALLLQASASALPLQSECIDHVFLIAVLGEIPDRARALVEVRRVLRPGGRLSVSEQFPDPDFVTRSHLRRELAAAGFVEMRTKGRLVYTSTWSSVTRDPSTLCPAH